MPYLNQIPSVLSERVLIVEGSRMINRVLRHLIKTRLGFHCDVAVSMAEARQLMSADDNEYLAALLDLNLPDAPDGEAVELALEVGIPAIILTSNYSDSLHEEFLDRPIVDFVLKENRNAYDYIIRLLRRLDRNREITALVVNTSAAMSQHITQLLQRRHFKVLTADGGQQALEVLEQNPTTRLAIIDYQISDINGVELLTRIRQDFDTDQMAILGLSDQTDSNLTARFIKNGANDFLGKGFSPEEFFCRVMQHMEALEYIDTLKDTANRDFLTGLYNRRYFFTAGVEQFHETRQQGRTLSAAMLDIDYFKQVNDRHGHQVGDTVLKQLAGMLRREFPHQIVARLGGEEFCILFPGMDAAVANEILEEFQAILAGNNLELEDGRQLDYTISVGISEDGKDLDELIHEADNYLYSAKNTGRNRICTRGMQR